VSISTPVPPMPATAGQAMPGGARSATRRHYLMCAPEHFDVTYAINPWMEGIDGADPILAMRQWEELRAVYTELGHQVDLITPEPGLPDMVFAANGGLVIGGRAYGARFTYPERHAEGPAYLNWFAGAGLRSVHEPRYVNEGEGDILLAGDVILAGTGFRTDPKAHAEVEAIFGRPVISLELVSPWFYHLDTALTVLDDDTIAYFPGAFSPASQSVLEHRYPDAILATEQDAAVLGLNAVSDGYNVVLTKHAGRLTEELRARGFNPIGVDLSELLKAGGGAKCCTLELHP
jgi:N-dimethylarginine dimethylaminohydrolase